MEMPLNTGFSGDSQPETNGVIRCKETHPLLLKCFKACLEYSYPEPIKRAEFVKAFSSPVCIILGHDYQTSLPKITKMSYLGSTISLGIGVIGGNESHSLLLQDCRILLEFEYLYIVEDRSYSRYLLVHNMLH